MAKTTYTTHTQTKPKQRRRSGLPNDKRKTTPRNKDKGSHLGTPEEWQKATQIFKGDIHHYVFRYKMGNFIDNRIVFQLAKAHVEAQRRQQDLSLKLNPF